MKFEDIIRLAFAQSLVLGHCPDKLSLDQVNKKVALSNQDLASFGLFDTSSPNYTTYYPDVTAEDLQPKDSEFIYPVFRLLSEVIVHKNWNPIDFSQSGILKDSMKMLLGQTVNVDHETAIGNAIGSVQQVNWQEAYVSSSGVKVPAGINGRLKIDGKSNPRIARGILMDPPSIHSNSVTVAFEWEKSHPKMTDAEFFQQLGKTGPDKELVRRIVTKVRDYRETSLVGAGADPYARIIKDGEILDPKKAARAYNSLGGIKHSTSLFTFSYKTDVISNESNEASEETIPTDPINIKPEITMNKTLAILAAMLGLTVEQLNASDDAASTSLNNIQTELNELRVGKIRLDAEIAGLKVKETSQAGRITELEAITAASLEVARAEVSRLHELTNPGADNTVMLAAINKYDLATCQAALVTLQALADEKFPVTCKTCGGHEINRASATADPSGAAGAFKAKSHAQVLEELTAENFSAESIHGKAE